MSFWTHVMATFETGYIEDADEVFGKSCTWDEMVAEYDAKGTWELSDEQTEHPERFMPCGSEGTLHRTIADNGNKTVVTICGGLRDYVDEDAVAEWFKSCCSKLGCNTRAMCVIDGADRTV